MKTRQVILLCLLGVSAIISAQISENRKAFFSMWFGVRDIKFPPLEKNGSLDFYDFYQNDAFDDFSSSYRYNYEYLGFEYFSVWDERFSSDLKMTMRSDFSFNTIYLRGLYYPIKQIGISLTWYTYPQLLNSFTPYYEQKYSGFTNSLDDENWWQWQVFEHTFSAGVILPLRSGGLTLTPGIHGGVAINDMFKKTLNRKEHNSNYKDRTDFTFLLSPALFIQPEVTCNFDLIKFRESSLGIQFQWRYLYMTKALDYKKVTYEWTMDSPQTTTINGNKHRYSAMEFDVGLRYSW